MNNDDSSSVKKTILFASGSHSNSIPHTFISHTQKKKTVIRNIYMDSHINVTWMSALDGKKNSPHSDFLLLTIYDFLHQRENESITKDA